MNYKLLILTVFCQNSLINSSDVRIMKTVSEIVVTKAGICKAHGKRIDLITRDGKYIHQDGTECKPSVTIK